MRPLSPPHTAILSRQRSAFLKSCQVHKEMFRTKPERRNMSWHRFLVKMCNEACAKGGQQTLFTRSDRLAVGLLSLKIDDRARDLNIKLAVCSCSGQESKANAVFDRVARVWYDDVRSIRLLEISRDNKAGSLTRGSEASETACVSRASLRGHHIQLYAALNAPRASLFPY
jgi:hypothetical protein